VSKQNAPQSKEHPEEKNDPKIDEAAARNVRRWGRQNSDKITV
jgi:hypothetical protein